MGCQESDSSHSCLVELVGSLCPQLTPQRFCCQTKPLVGLEQALAPRSVFPNLLRSFHAGHRMPLVGLHDVGVAMCFEFHTQHSCLVPACRQQCPHGPFEVTLL